MRETTLCGILLLLVASSSATTVTVQVPANTPYPHWFDSGVSVSVGDSLQISASGLWAYGGGPYPYGWNGPEGNGEQGLGTWLVPGAPAYSLVGRIGESNGFEIGLGGTFDALTYGTGELRLAHNDQINGYSDNQGFVTVIITNGATEEPVYFADPSLRAAVEQALGKTNPTPADMLGLSEFYAERRGITNLTGLEYATNLTDLDLGFNEQISDISPLSGLSNLTNLDLAANQISDISAVSGLTNLRELDLGGNKISDISALSALTNLIDLYLGWNPISDTTPLSGLTNLTRLWLDDNLTRLSDISALSGLTNLTDLFLYGNQIADISAVSGLTDLTNLDLSNNQISDVSPLSNLTKLTDLRVIHNQISDISGLSGLTSLAGVDLRWNPLNSDAYNIYIPLIRRNNPGVDIQYDPPAGVQVPSVSTLVATGIGQTSATLNGSISNDGGQACQYQFRYKKSGGSYTTTTWTGSKTTGQSFTEAVSGLEADSTYYFNAKAKNSAGESDWGNEQSFVTSTSTQRTLIVSCSSGGSVIDPGIGSYSYSDGEQVRLEAKADPGYHFTKWSGSISASSNPMWITMDADYDVQANFEKDAAASQVYSLSGQVRHGQSQAVLSGVKVTLSGQTAYTDSHGTYSFSSIDATRPATLTATKSAFTDYTAQIDPPSGAKSKVYDFLMFPAAAGKPVITGLTSKYSGMFLAGVSVGNEYTASISWNGTPGTVEFYTNNTLKATVPGTSTGGAAVFDMGKDFVGALGASGNRVRVRAINAEGGTSDWYERLVVVLPLPDALRDLLSLIEVQIGGQEAHVAVDFDFPRPPIRQVLDLPVIGKFGFDVAANASFDYTVTDGDWEVALGVGAEGEKGKRGRRPLIPGIARDPKLKLYIGNTEISGSIEGGARGTATVSKGISFDEVFASAGIGGKFEIGRVGVPDLILAGATTALSKIPGLEDALLPLSVVIYVEPEIAGDLICDLQPQFAFKSLEMNGDIALEASYEPDLGICKMHLCVGGKPGITLQYPGDLIKELRFKAYASAEFSTWIFTFGPYECIFIDLTYPASKTAATYASAASSLEEGVTRQMHPIDRSYLADGLARFVVYGHVTRPQNRLFAPESDGDRATALQNFRAMALDGGRGMRSQEGTIGSGANPVQADLPLIENVFPDSEPAMASHGRDLMLLYVSDNGTAGSLQFTDINWMRFDGNDWSQPVAIRTDTRAEFAPRVAFDGNGDAVAVWERVKDPNFNIVDITAMASQMEILWSRWDKPSGQWSEPAPMTDNNYLDHTPLLCGPMTDGSLLLAWTQNSQNLLMGDVTSPDTVLWSRWDPALRSWSDPQPLLVSLASRQSQSLAGAGQYATYAWIQDMDGDLGDPNDQELFICQWNAQSWGFPIRLTNDALPDRNVRVAVAEPNDFYIVWQHAADLVMSRNLGDTSLVREDSQTAGFTDYAMTLGPGGNLVLLWEEQSDTGPDAFYSVYDPISGRWSKDNRFFTDSSLERSFAPIWDSGGNLTVAFDRVQMSKTTKTVRLADGEIVTVDNVPTPGRVDLSILKRRLVKDLAFKEGDLTADANDYLPGSEVTLRARVRNVGDLSVSDATVAFYDGDPSNGGKEIGRRTISGWMDGETEQEAQTTSLIPEPAKVHVFYALIDPDHQVDDSDRNNNQLSLSVGGTDLALRLISATAEPDGSARIIVEVRNAGAPVAPANTLALRDVANASVTILTKQVPELAPGQTAELALDLPVGVLPPGDACLTVRVDDANQVSDADADNNRVTFSIYIETPSPGTVPNGIPDPIAHWTFDEGSGTIAGDSAGSQNGTVYGASWIEGKVGGALSFDGMNDYVDCGNADVLAPEKLTLSLWTSLPTPSYKQYVVGKALGISPVKDYSVACTAEGRVEFYFSDSAGKSVTASTSSVIPSDTWVHIAAVRDGSRALLYINGVLDGSKDYAFTCTNQQQPLTLGLLNPSLAMALFKGKIDDVCLYDVPLSESEVMAVYQQTAGQ